MVTAIAMTTDPICGMSAAAPKAKKEGNRV